VGFVQFSTFERPIDVVKSRLSVRFRKRSYSRAKKKYISYTNSTILQFTMYTIDIDILLLLLLLYQNMITRLLWDLKNKRFTRSVITAHWPWCTGLHDVSPDPATRNPEHVHPRPPKHEREQPLPYDVTLDGETTP